MEEYTITVKVADKHGFTRYMLNPAETLEMLQNLPSSSWIYADNHLIQADQVDEANLSTLSKVKILPALVGGEQCEEHLIQVTISEAGQRHYQLNPQETLEKIQAAHSGAWIWVGNDLIEAEKVTLEHLSHISRVRILPALVRETTISPHVGEEE
jgi:hypothetical protein